MLFKNLNSVLADKNIYLANEMTASLNAYGKSSLVQYIDGVINGFEYFDTKIYLQVYLPFIANMDLTKTPVVATNFDGEERLNAYYAGQVGRLSTMVVDENYATNNPVFVISGNESVDGSGELPKFAKDGYNKTAQVNKVNIAEKKEDWANGKADIAYKAFHMVYATCTKETPLETDYFVKIANNQLNNWVTVSSSLAAFANANNPPQTLWNANENIIIIFYERDVRKKFERTNNGFAYLGCSSCQNNSNFNFIYRSKETPYGVCNLLRGNYHNPSPGGINTAIIGTGNFSCSSFISGAQFEIKTQNWN